MQGKCEQCHTRCADDELFYIRGRECRVCRKCAKKFFEKCPECGNYYCPEDMLSRSDSRRVCFWCAAEKYYICPRCRVLTSNDDKVHYHGYSICRKCFEAKRYQCENCGNNFDVSQMAAGLQLCRRCDDTRPIKCHICRKTVFKRYARESGSFYYCQQCYEMYFKECSECKEIFPGHLLSIHKKGKKHKLLCPVCLHDIQQKTPEFDVRDYMERCIGCDKMIPASRCFMLDDLPYCPECKASELQKCRRCGKYGLKEFMHLGVCSDCFYKHVSRDRTKDIPDEPEVETTGGIDYDYLGNRLILGAMAAGMLGMGKSHHEIPTPVRQDFCEESDDDY